MSSADPFSSRFEVFGREPAFVVGEINQQPYEKLQRLLDLGEGGDGRVVLLRAPRAGFGKTSLLQRLADEFAESHQFVRVNLVSGRTTDATHVLEYVLQALCQVLPESSTLTILDNLSRKVLALGLEPLVASGEVPCQDREGALAALREQPTETFDFHHDRAVTAHWTKSNFEILGPRLAAELGRLSGASLRESSYWVELLFRFSTTAPDNVERARLLFETVFRGDMQNQSESAAEERLHGLLAILGTVTSLVLIVDDTEGLSTHPPDALALASFLTNLSQCCPGSLVVLSVNQDIWESAFLPLLPGGLADRLMEHDVMLRPLTEDQARELVKNRAEERAAEVLEEIELGSGDLYARQVLKAASDVWETLDHAPALEVVEAEGESAEELDDDDPSALGELDDDLDDLEDLDLEGEDTDADTFVSDDNAEEKPAADLESVTEIPESEAFEESVAVAEESVEAPEEESASEVTGNEADLAVNPFAPKFAEAAESDAGSEAESVFASMLEDSAPGDEIETPAEMAAEPSASESNPFTAGAPAEEPAHAPADTDVEDAQPASTFPTQIEAEPNPFLGKELSEPEVAEAPQSIFAPVGEPPVEADQESRPFTAAPELEEPAEAAASAREESSTPFEAATDSDSAQPDGEGEESRGVAQAEPPEAPTPFAPGPPIGIPNDAGATAADDNPFMPRFGQPLAPPLQESAPEAPAPEAEVQPPPFGGPPPILSPAQELEASSLPPAFPPEPTEIPQPFAAGAPPVDPLAPGFGPPTGPPAFPDVPPPLGPSESEESADPAGTDTDDADAESTQPASPFAALGRGSAEKDLGDVSSIFAPIEPAPDVTLDPDKLTPLLEDADDAGNGNAPAPREAEAAPSAFAAGAAPPVDNPFSAGAPPASPPADAESPGPFAPLGEGSASAPIAPGPFDSGSAFQPMGEPPADRDSDNEMETAAPPASPSAFTPAPQHSLDSPSAFGAAALGPFSAPAEEAAKFEPTGDLDAGSAAPFQKVDRAEEESPPRPSSPFAETETEPKAPHELDSPLTSGAESGSKAPPVELTATQPAPPEFDTAADRESPLEAIDAPFKPVAAPTAQDASASPFAKVEPSTAPQRTELPPKKVELPEPMSGESSPFEPGQPPSFETPAPMAAPATTESAATAPVPGFGSASPASTAAAESQFETPSSEDSSPFSAIGQTHSEPPASFSAPDTTTSPTPDLGGMEDPEDQDKVDELLRQFKERYGRK